MVTITPPPANFSAACVTGYLALTKSQNAADGVAFCTEQFKLYTASVADTISNAFGGPALVLGACWPFLMVSLLISISRLIKIINARSVFLVISSLGNAVFVLAVAYALHSSSSNFLASDQAGLVGLVIMLIFVCMAGIVRFAHVITKTRYRNMFQRGMCAGYLLYGGFLAWQAGKEIADAPVYPTIFSQRFVFLFLVPVVVYLLGGLFCFSWNLPSARSTAVSSGATSGAEQPFAMLRTLRLVNDVMMGIILAVCISQLGVAFPVRKTTYNNSVVCLHVSILLFIENIFETVTNSLRGRGVFSQPSELSTFSRQHHPYQNTSAASYPPGAGGPSGKVVPEPAGGSSSKVGPAGSYIGRESWAFKGQEPGYGTAGPSYPPQGRSYDSPNYPPNYPPARSYERPSGSRGG
ncbi:hypothetical protein BDZ88DRAFT_418603 [Geranomyces variabilis]|nr:hypothetical protein BDZ88DRAFT_418603 [Geranomyces variabilis]KAJ3133359.1 hypothetical protein HDU90_006308 [Geranomyces variabilis]